MRKEVVGIRSELRNIEDMLVIEAANHVGMNYADQSSDKLLQAWRGRTLITYIPSLKPRRRVKGD